MQRFATLTTMLIIAALACAVGCAPKTVKYAPFSTNVGKFSVEVPERYKNFKIEHSVKQSPRGKIKTITYTSLDDVMGFSVIVMEMNFPEEYLNPQRTREILGRLRDQAAKRGPVLRKGETKVSGQLALTLRSSVKAKDAQVYMESLYTIIDNREYQVNFVSPKEKGLDSEIAKRFLSSFKYKSETKPKK